MINPLVRELAAAGAPVRVPVAVTCRILKIAKQPYHRWLPNPVSDRDWADAHLANAAFDVHAEDPAFGYRFIADELADAGFAVSERRVWRVCSEHAVTSVIQRKRHGKTIKVGPPVRDDLVQRSFSASKPDRLWLTDITEHWTGAGKLYLCAVKDVFSNPIVGYSIDARMTSDLAVNALRMPVQRRRPGVLSRCILIVELSSEAANASMNSTVTNSSDRWDASVPLAITPLWSPSSRSRKRTFSTSAPGTVVNSYGSRS